MDEGGPLVAIQYTHENRETYSIKWFWNTLQHPYSGPRIILGAQFHLFSELRQLPNELIDRIFNNMCPVDTQRHYLDLDLSLLQKMTQEEIDRHRAYQRTANFIASKKSDHLNYKRYKAMVKPCHVKATAWMGWNYYRKAYNQTSSVTEIRNLLCSINDPSDALTILHLPNFMNHERICNRYNGYYSMHNRSIPSFVDAFPWNDLATHRKFNFYLSIKPLYVGHNE